MAIPAMTTANHPLALSSSSSAALENDGVAVLRLQSAVTISTALSSLGSPTNTKGLTDARLDNGRGGGLSASPQSMSSAMQMPCSAGRSALHLTNTKPARVGPSIPSITTHFVSASDTLAGICVMYGVKTADIKRHNRMWTNDSIHLRRSLEIPLPSVMPSQLLHDGEQGHMAAGPRSGPVQSSLSKQRYNSGSANSRLSLDPLPYSTCLDLHHRPMLGSTNASYRGSPSPSSIPHSSLSLSAVSPCASDFKSNSGSPSSTSSYPHLPAPHPPTVSELLSQIDRDVEQILGDLEEAFVNGVTLPIYNEQGGMYPPPAAQASHSLSRLSRPDLGSAYPRSASSGSSFISYRRSNSLSRSSSHDDGSTHSMESTSRNPCASIKRNTTLWAASSSTTRVKIMPMSSQAASAHMMAAAPLHVMFEWTPLFGHVLPPEVQESVEENLKGQLRKRLIHSDLGHWEFVLERAPQGRTRSRTHTSDSCARNSESSSRSRSSHDEFGPGEWVGLNEINVKVLG
ncbi:hypothetical protein BSLG_004744 [Batrachochytrium salamandrivorans]|nr:hypothetical protein BSLG_004744 [Batrachochytrium salamandrivorans]